MATRRSPAAASSSSTTTTISDKWLELIEELTTNVDAVQERVLAEILRRNADSEYLAARCGGLAGAGGASADRATFRAKVPMATYEDVRPYILRVANGDTSPVLTGSGNPVAEFFLSSGTSAGGGEPKLIPVEADHLDRANVMRSLAMAVLGRHVPGLDQGSALYFSFVSSKNTMTTTPGGLPARTALTSILQRRLADSHNKLSPAPPPYDACRSYTSPPAAILCEDATQSMYAQMLCGLCRRHAVARVGAPFAYAVVRAVRFLQLNRRDLAADVAAGELVTKDRVTDPSVRAAVAGVLRLRRRRPDPELAQLLADDGGGGGGGDDDWARGVVARVWPNARCVETAVTGSMAQYVAALDYYSGGLPIVSTRYACSECCFGINLRPLCDPGEVSYTILPNMAYFEFLPVETDGDGEAMASELVELAGVEAGREYEAVVTTFAGLCRYRVGDVLRVTGFHNAAPQFRFVRRRNVLLSVDTEKTEEAELQRAVERAASTLLLHGGGAGAAAAVLDYTSRACTESIPGHYVVYWELLRRLDGGGGHHDRSVDDGGDGDGDGDGEVLDRCCLEMEEALGSVYRKLRAVDGTIGPLEIRVVRPGTFEELADCAVAHGGASLAQYKVPRCVTAPAMVQLLDARVVSSHSSPAPPHWAPAGGHCFD